MKRAQNLVIITVVGLLIFSLSAGTVLAAAGIGKGTIRDSKAKSDSISIVLTGVTPAGAGKAYEGWLLSDDGAKKTSIGILTPDSAGNASKTYTSATGEHLVGAYSKLVITVEPSPDTDPAPSTTVATSYTIPTSGVTHLRHILYQWDAAPSKKGFYIGLREQAKIADDHANLALATAKAGDLAGAKSHAGHVINIVEGSKGANFGKSTTVNPGDGFGVLPYANGGVQHSGFAAQGLASSNVIVVNSTRSADAGNAAVADFTLARDKALQVLSAPAALTAEVIASDMANATGKGVTDSNNAYLAAQDMAGYEIDLSKPAGLPVVGDLTFASVMSMGTLLVGSVLLLGGFILRRRARYTP